MNSMAQIDPAADGQLELKKRARRRLVGAVALALAAVIVLPMVMDQEPKPLTQDIQIRIPSQDAAPVRPSVVAAQPAAPDEAAVKADIAKPETVKAEPPKAVSPAESAKAVETPKAVPIPKVAESASPVVAEPKSGAKSESQQAQWILQLGAYQDQANVRALLAKLKKFGYPSYTEKVQTAQGSRTRVRGGPFATRRAAEKAQAQLKKIGAGGPPGGVIAQKQ